MSWCHKDINNILKGEKEKELKMSFLAGIVGKKKKKKTAAEIKADEERREKERREKLARLAKRTGRSDKSATVRDVFYLHCHSVIFSTHS